MALPPNTVEINEPWIMLRDDGWLSVEADTRKYDMNTIIQILRKLAAGPLEKQLIEAESGSGGSLR